MCSREPCGYWEACAAFYLFPGFSLHLIQMVQKPMGEGKSVDPLLARLEGWLTPRGHWVFVATVRACLGLLAALSMMTPFAAVLSRSLYQ